MILGMATYEGEILVLIFSTISDYGAVFELFGLHSLQTVKTSDKNSVFYGAMYTNPLRPFQMEINSTYYFSWTGEKYENESILLPESAKNILITPQTLYLFQFSLPLFFPLFLFVYLNLIFHGWGKNVKSILLPQKIY